MPLDPFTPTNLDSTDAICSETNLCSENKECSDIIGQGLDPFTPAAI